MMKDDARRWMVAVALLLLWGLMGVAKSPSFERLDSLIDAQADLIAHKQARIDEMKANLVTITEPGGRYEAMKRLYEEYSAFQYDSAFAYASGCVELAQSMHDERLLNESYLDLAHILSTAFLIDQARQTLARVDTTRLPPGQLVWFHRINTDLLIYQAEYMQGTRYAQDAVARLIELRRHIAGISGSRDDVNYLLTVAECHADAGQYRQAIRMLEGLMQHYHSGQRLYSIITSTMSFYYSQMGNRDRQMSYLVKSAESDLEGCIRENTSLRAIADLLFEEGDIDRAYRYMRVAVDDANFYGTRLRNIQASRIVPSILNAYQTKQDRNHRNMMWLLAAISVIALLLVVGVIAIYQLLKRYRRLNQQKKAINAQLRQVNAQLGDTVEQLHETNGLLREREKIKEEYIARFLTLSSRFIDRGEEQRKALYRLYRDRKTEELARELKNTHHGNENAQLFYQNFDNAFLNIYPTFVDEVNKLLQEDGKIEVKQGKRLTTESRVLALIRLGINDNQSIAAILRASLTTIYTYRSKLKARALDKDSFEARVKSIE